MEKNINILCEKIFKDKSSIPLSELLDIKQLMINEIYQFKFHSHPLTKNGKLSPEEFCKNILSNLVPSEAISKIRKVEELVKSQKILFDMSYNDFVAIQRFFNEYKRYFKVKKTSNLSREKLKEIFEMFCRDYDQQIENDHLIDNLFNLIDFDGNENLDFKELGKFMFRQNTGGRCDKEGQNSGFKPWYDLQKKAADYKQKAEEIIEILKR